MLDKDYFSHNSSNSEPFSARLKRFHYGYSAAGENIAWGSGPYGPPESIFETWMNSPDHKVNILDGGFREIGIGVRSGTYQNYDGAAMYTVDFGTRR